MPTKRLGQFIITTSDDPCTITQLLFQPPEMNIQPISVILSPYRQSSLAFLLTSLNHFFQSSSTSYSRWLKCYMFGQMKVIGDAVVIYQMDGVSSTPPYTMPYEVLQIQLTLLLPCYLLYHLHIK